MGYSVFTLKFLTFTDFLKKISTTKVLLVECWVDMSGRPHIKKDGHCLATSSTVQKLSQYIPDTSAVILRWWCHLEPKSHKPVRLSHKQGSGVSHDFSHHGSPIPSPSQIIVRSWPFVLHPDAHGTLWCLGKTNKVLMTCIVKLPASVLENLKKLHSVKYKRGRSHQSFPEPNLTNFVLKFNQITNIFQNLTTWFLCIKQMSQIFS